MYDFRFDVVWNNLPFLLQGVVNTLLVTVVAMGIGVLVGLASAIVRLAGIPVLTQLTIGYVEFFRGTPALVQVIWFFFCLPIFLGVHPSALVSGTLALGLNAGAFLSEIFRAGIQAIPVGHVEAGLSLGMSRALVMRRIVLPEAVRIVLPPLGNNLISLLKDSSLVSVIAVAELMRKADELNTITYRPLEVYTVAAMLYFAMTFSLAQVMLAIERRLSRRRKRGGV